MGGRLQNVALWAIALSVIASCARADGPGGLERYLSQPRAGGPLLNFSHADAEQRWKLLATAAREPWSAAGAASPGFVERFSQRHGLEGESRRAALSFDLERRAAGGQWQAHAHAAGEEAEFLLDAPSARPSQRHPFHRLHRFAADTTFTRAWALGPFASTFAAELGLAAEGSAATGFMSAPGPRPFEHREERLRQDSFGLRLHNELWLTRGLRARTSIGVERYRLRVDSSAAGGGSAQGTAFSPSISLVAQPGRRTELFVSAARGMPEGTLFAARDPRTGSPLARVDPLAATDIAQAGIRHRWSETFATTLSAWRSRSRGELLLTGQEDVSWIARPATREGVTLSATWEPASWARLTLQATALEARYADGAAEPLPAAARHYATAGATVKRRGWSASLFVSHLGGRTGFDEEGLWVRSSTTVGAQVAARFGKGTRLTFDVFNVFDQRMGDIDYFTASRAWPLPGALGSFLFHPAEPRGFRLGLRTTF